MVNFLHYGQHKKPASTQAPAKVVVAESTAKVLEEEQINIQPVDTVEEVVEKINKSKKVRAKKEKDGNVRVKQVLKD